MEDNTKMYSDIIENDSEVQPSVSTVDIKIEEPKVEEPKQRISDVSPDDYIREHVLYDLTDELLVAANRRSLNLPPVSLFSSENELLSSFSDRSTTESSEVSGPKGYTSVLEKLLEFEEISMEIRNPSSKTGKHLPPIPLCLQQGIPISDIGAFMSPTEICNDENNIENINMPPISGDLENAEGQESLCVPVDVLDVGTSVYNDCVLISEIEAFMSPTDIGSDKNNIENINMPPISGDLENAEGQESLCVPVNVLDVDTSVYNDCVLISEIEVFMSPTDMDSDENNIENINMPPISGDLENAEGQESLCVPVDVLDVETIIHNDSVESNVIGPEKSTTKQPRPKRRALSALWGGLLKASKSLCCWRCK